MLISTPCPGMASKVSASGMDSPIMFALLIMASARGCSEPFSAMEAARMTSSWVPHKRYYFSYLRFSPGERPCFIKDNRIQFLRSLKIFSSPYKDPQFSALADADH